jgi:Prohead core protein serine protease
MVKKNEVVAMLLMESTTDPVKPQNLQVHDKGGLFYVKFDTVLQRFNAQNRNRREYNLDAMRTSLQAPHILELMNQKSWKGEAGHPHTTDTARILTIDPKLTSHKINNFRHEGTLLKGEVETLDDGQYGTQMTKNILQGMEPAFSLRALAALTKRGDGSSVVQNRCHVVTYDWVILPSHKEAYRDQSRPIQTVVKNIEDAGNIATESSIAVPVMESQIKNFIALESANAKLVSNVCEVALESMTLTEDLSHVILTEGSNKYAVKVEERIKQDVRHFMAKL